MAHSTWDVYSSSPNDWQDSSKTLTTTEPRTIKDECTSDGLSLYNEEKSFDDSTGSVCEDSSAVGGAQDDIQSQAETKAADLDEFKSIKNLTNDKVLVCLNLKGKMVVKGRVKLDGKMVIMDCLIDREMLQRFEERYGEGDCLHLAKIYYQDRDAEAFVVYMTKIAGGNDKAHWFRDDHPCTLRFASYWLGWDAHKNNRFRKPGPCIGDHIVLREASPSPSELQFMHGNNLSPKFDPKMIIERNYATDIPCDYPKNVRTPEHSWLGALDWFFNPDDDVDRQDDNATAFYPMQTVSRLREVFDDPSQGSPSYVSSNDPEGENGPLSATWISMDHEDRRKHLEQRKSDRESKRAKLRSQTNYDHYRQSSEPRSGSRILSYERYHSSRMLSHRKHDA